MRLVLEIVAVAVLLYVLKRFPKSRWILAAALCIPLVFIFAPHELRHWYQSAALN
jgi:predicted LPLAT superfamily acyltransferase